MVATLVLVWSASPNLRAQDDLLGLLGDEKVKEPVVASFKGTRLINFHTLEVPGRRTLDFRISHRFGAFNSGWYDFFGLDGGASIRLGLEYSYDGRLEVGIGRTSYEKMLDGFLKYRLLRQMSGGGSPVSVTLFSSMFYTMQKDPDKAVNGFDKYAQATNRMSFAHQVIIGRKFSDRFSLQIAPVYIHYNLVDRISDKNDAVVVAAATRFKVTKRSAITLEYGWRATQYSREKYYDSLGVGWDIETGGHVFQLFVTNSFGLLENQYFTHTTNQWSNMGIRLGFNISRVFTL
ncbi:MAG: hypothetical protein IPL65_02100 [Lewinellaceae bacterium]|nr:hypothetical protein [Lewinellaceae bacterium]